MISNCPPRHIFEVNEMGNKEFSWSGLSDYMHNPSQLAILQLIRSARVKNSLCSACNQYL